MSVNADPGTRGDALRWVDAAAVAGLGRRRSAVLDVLRASHDPVSVADVAERTRMHVNTARFHLDGLVADGLAVRTAEDRTAPGRPRILYTAAGPVSGPRSYQLLAEMLSGLVAGGKHAGSAAADVGRSWGRHLVERAAPSVRVGADDATERLLRVLDDVGFRPCLGHGESGETEVDLHHCPFREVAERHRDVVCSIHLGLMQGALDELRAPLEVTALDPFVTPQLCVAHLRATTPVPSEEPTP